MDIGRLVDALGTGGRSGAKLYALIISGLGSSGIFGLWRMKTARNALLSAKHPGCFFQLGSTGMAFNPEHSTLVPSKSVSFSFVKTVQVFLCP